MSTIELTCVCGNYMTGELSSTSDELTDRTEGFYCVCGREYLVHMSKRKGDEE